MLLSHLRAGVKVFRGRGRRARDREHDAHVQLFSARSDWFLIGSATDIVECVGGLGEEIWWSDDEFIESEVRRGSFPFGEWCWTLNICEDLRAFSCFDSSLQRLDTASSAFPLVSYT